MDGNKVLPIWIGHSEAAAILMKLQGASAPRPMTHDLFSDVLGQLQVQVVRIAVTELRENTFYAQITVQQDGSEFDIDSRPSDAIALASRVGAPIWVADAVMTEAGVLDTLVENSDEDDDEEPDVDRSLDEFKRFIDDVEPEDFR